MKYLRLLRVKHYIKNGLVFLPLFFAKRVTAVDLLLKSLLAFAVFCLISSAVYIINDIRDAEMDKLHPTKCKRPIASGAVSEQTAWVICALLLAGAAAIIFFTGQGALFWLLPAIYLIINVGYSMGLKHVPIVDIAILAAGYLLRVMYGATFTGIPISGWMYLTVIAVAFYLGLGKRRGEMLSVAGDDTRFVLRFYNKGFLDKNMLMCVTLGIVFYSLWTVDAGTIEHVGGEQAVWTVPLVIMIFFKYSMSAEGKSDGDPVEIVLRDKLLLALVALLGLALFGIVYF
ncbi:MAG: decaprenyl-phosphate phosphoribosyltransferase [Clostridiales bacterium]|nr:decaprenyl-phosphate phosphoribosyltransferase [Clostridiales bacterium]